MNAQRRIVAEISVSWPKDNPQVEDLLGSKFEEVIEVNRQRGFSLESWQFQSSTGKAIGGPVPAGALTETIIAVFVQL